MQFTRSAGVLLHPTSLPGRYGIGDLGDGAYEFVDFLAVSYTHLDVYKRQRYGASSMLFDGR